jgi:hypothetical protein
VLYHEDMARRVAAELSEPVDARVTAIAAAIAAQHPGARAVLFYGSCLREAQLDGLMLDFYLIVADYRTAYARRWLAAANRLIPPNVFPFQHCGLIAKYAVLSEVDFAALNRPEAPNVSVWARFSQPSRLVWAADDAAQGGIVAAVMEAPVTLFQLTLPMLAPDRDCPVNDIWREGFARTYRAELRAERTGRSGSIIDADPDRYYQLGNAALSLIAERMGVGPNGEVPVYASRGRLRWRWRWLQWRGKALSVVRLAKAAFTYSGGIDYLAWKINRHAGADIVISPWMRRWPLAAALVLVPRLMWRGAIR